MVFLAAMGYSWGENPIVVWINGLDKKSRMIQNIVDQQFPLIDSSRKGGRAKVHCKLEVSTISVVKQSKEQEKSKQAQHSNSRSILIDYHQAKRNALHNYDDKAMVRALSHGRIGRRRPFQGPFSYFATMIALRQSLGTTSEDGPLLRTRLPTSSERIYFGRFNGPLGGI